MRILIIGATPNYNAEHYFGRAFSSLGHGVSYLDQYEGVRRRTLLRLLTTRSRALRFVLGRLRVNRIRDFGSPDLVLVFKGEMLTEETLRRLSELNAYLFYTDAYKFPVLLRGRLHYFSGVIVPTERMDFFYRLGARRVLASHWACDPMIHRPLGIPKRYDVSFVGTFYPNRWRTLRVLRVKPHIFGSMWALRAGIHHPPAYGEEYVGIINETRVNLNVHHPKDLEADAPNTRTFEVAGSGGFLLTEDMPSIRFLLPSAETYSSVEELNEKVEYYLRDERAREERAEALVEECREGHTYSRRAEEILRSVS